MPTAQGFFLTTMDEEEINGTFERFPKLGERVRDWRIIATQGGYVVVHIIIDYVQAVVDRLRARPEYLGKSYKKIAQNAKASDQTCLQVIKKIVFTSWEIPNPDYPADGPATIAYRGSLGEWLAAGRPPRLSGWFPAHVWLGNHVDVPDESEVE